jgi:type VI protein secretion system component Hcp
MNKPIFKLANEKLLFFSIFGILFFSFSVGDVYGPMYMKIGDIPGESADANHDKWIDVLSIDLTPEKTESSQIIDFTKTLDSSSSMISEAAITGKIFPRATVHICSEETDRVNCEEYQLTDVSFTRYFISVSGNDYPKENISLSYSEVKKSLEKSIENVDERIPDEIPGKMMASTKVPSWVQTTATFWIDGNVSDREFTDGIGFLVKEGIIELDEKIETLTDDIPAEPEIPSWIKESTKWWVEDLVPEDQFLESIKWLIKNNIIRGVPST